VEHLPKVGPVRAPAQGEHSRQILGELGMTDKEIETLVNDGAVGATPCSSELS
jgi:crotonobetainyl-CoA:carnitine CoA-transferase CaiB-like acyl-CoA transferase